MVNRENFGKIYLAAKIYSMQKNHFCSTSANIMFLKSSIVCDCKSLKCAFQFLTFYIKTFIDSFVFFESWPKKNIVHNTECD
jgi:hypothetical protein